MASNINITDIDVEFPVPGQDNDSQGFRDNFTTILDNFEAAKTEIETLQTDTAKVNADTTFLETEDSTPATLINANLKAHTEQYYTPAIGNISNSYTIDFTDGGYQVITLAGNTNFVFDGWAESGRFGRVTVHLITDGTPRTANFDNSEGAIYFDSANENLWTQDDTIGTVAVSSEVNPVVLEFCTYNGGSTIYGKYIGQFTATPGA